jgi:hypothetical protein
MNIKRWLPGAARIGVACLIIAVQLASVPRASAQLNCGLTVGLIRETAATGYTKAQIKADLQDGWGGVVGSLEVIEGESVDPNETVLVVREREAGVPNCRAPFVDLLGGSEVALLGQPSKVEPAVETSLGSPCQVAQEFARNKRLQSRFPFAVADCKDVDGVEQAVVYLGAKIVDSFENCVSGDLLFRLVPLASRSVDERCEKLSLRMRQDLDHRAAASATPVLVVVDGDNSVIGYGRVVLNNAIAGVLNMACLPGRSYLNWVTAHEMGHLMLQVNTHPSKTDCPRNIMTLENRLGEITDSQVRRVCEKGVAQCTVNCATLKVSLPPENDCL